MEIEAGISDCDMNADCPMRLFSLSFNHGFENILKDMIRREESLLASFSSSLAHASSLPDLIEYLQFQSSRLISLLPFVKNIHFNDEHRDSIDIHATHDFSNCASNGCKHGVLCRIISPILRPVVFAMKARGRLRKKPKECTHVKRMGSGKTNEMENGAPRLNGRRNTFAESVENPLAKDVPRLNLDGVLGGGEQNPGDPFGLGSSCGASKASLSNHNGNEDKRGSPQTTFLPLTEMSYKEKVRLYIDVDASSNQSSSSSSSFENIVEPLETSRTIRSSRALDNCVAKSSPKADLVVASSTSSMPSLQAISSQSGKETSRSLNRNLKDAPRLHSDRSIMATGYGPNKSPPSTGNRISHRDSLAKNRCQTDPTGFPVGGLTEGYLSNSMFPSEYSNDGRGDTKSSRHQRESAKSGSLRPEAKVYSSSKNFPLSVSERVSESAGPNNTNPTIVSILRSLVPDEREKSCLLGLKQNLDGR